MPLTDPARAQGVQLPALDRLTGLTALNLSENTLEEVPPCLSKLTALRFLDLSLNHMLQARPLNSHASQGRQRLGSHPWPPHVLKSGCLIALQPGAYDLTSDILPLGCLAACQRWAWCYVNGTRDVPKLQFAWHVELP